MTGQRPQASRDFLAVLLIALLFGASVARSDDWPQWGGTPSRNNLSDSKDIPFEWNVGKFDRKTGQWMNETAEHILWVARLGTQSYGTPVIAGERVYCATNNGAGYLQRYPAKVDLGCLLSFRRSDGRFQWQLSREKLAAGSAVDWPHQGICCAPLVEGDRLWIVTNRGEVVCVDTEGFSDGENDGPFKDEPSESHDEADVVWYFDMMRELGIVQHNMCSCSVTAAGNLLFVSTGNGIDEAKHEAVPAPEAASFIALDKTTGKLVWADNSPGANILHGHWSSPAIAEIDGVLQAVFPGGDGWVYSFLAKPTESGKPELLWKFDCNPKQTVWENGGYGDRNSIIATPVIHEGLVYLATGQDPENGEGQGHLWCIDPTKRGDVSSEVVVDKEGRFVAPRRVQAVDEEAGEMVKPNPNSAAVWCYTGQDTDGDGELAFEETMHRTLGMVAIKGDLLVIADLSGLVHCLDRKTGKPHWTHDMMAAVWGSPLIVDGKIFVGNEDGYLLAYALSAELEILAENDMAAAVYSTPVAADGVLYVATRDRLFAIKRETP